MRFEGGELVAQLWPQVDKWATFSHANKPTDWVVHRYFGKFNKARQDRWVFGDRASGAFIDKFSWTNIVRHQIVRHGASPDDPALADYWAWRRKAPLPINRTSQRLYRAQDGCCAICRATLTQIDDRPQTPGDWEHWPATSRKTVDVIWEEGTSDKAKPRLIHLHCRSRRGRALQHANEPSGLA